MNTYKCIIESEELDDYLSASSLDSSHFSLVSSKGLGGELMTSAALITISVATISQIAKIIIALIDRGKFVKVTYKSTNIEVNIEGLNEEKVIKILSDLGKTNDN